MLQKLPVAGLNWKDEKSTSAGRRRPKDIPLLSYFVQDILDNNKAKIICIRF